MSLFILCLTFGLYLKKKSATLTPLHNESHFWCVSKKSLQNILHLTFGLYLKKVCNICLSLYWVPLLVVSEKKSAMYTPLYTASHFWSVHEKKSATCTSLYTTSHFWSVTEKKSATYTPLYTSSHFWSVSKKKSATYTHPQNSEL